MENSNQEKKLKDLQKLWRDFPWLWAILWDWNLDKVKVNVKFCDGLWLGAIQNSVNTQLWVFGVNKCAGVNRHCIENISAGLYTEEFTIADLLYRYLNKHPSFTVKFVILRFKDPNDFKEITILRPVKGQKSF